MSFISYIMEVDAPVLYDNLSINLNMLEAVRLEGLRVRARMNI